ncbi:hypothetical protein Lal_00003890 [Lupinus albus]|nr:hypothetical protein Lal_00003890 [Lupinus albus]
MAYANKEGDLVLKNILPTQKDHWGMDSKMQRSIHGEKGILRRSVDNGHHEHHLFNIPCPL